MFWHLRIVFGGLGEVRQVIRESFDKAYEAVIVAARAHEEARFPISSQVVRWAAT